MCDRIANEKIFFLRSKNSQLERQKSSIYYAFQITNNFNLAIYFNTAIFPHQRKTLKSIRFSKSEVNSNYFLVILSAVFASHQLQLDIFDCYSFLFIMQTM